MLLLLLLVFNSASGLSSVEYEEREVTSQRLQSLYIVSWPSVLLAASGDDPEVASRCWPLLTKWRHLKRLEVATAILDSGWPFTASEAKELYEDYLLWKALATMIAIRHDIKNPGQLLWPNLDPDHNK